MSGSSKGGLFSSWWMSIALVLAAMSGGALLVTNVRATTITDQATVDQLAAVNANLEGLRKDVAALHSAIGALPSLGAAVAIPLRGNPSISGPDFCQNIRGTYLGTIPGGTQTIPVTTVVCGFR